MNELNHIPLNEMLLMSFKASDEGNEVLASEMYKYDIKPESMTDRYKCRKCGSRKCSYYEVQTRSADEPMTQFITCLKCNTRWRQ